MYLNLIVIFIFNLSIRFIIGYDIYDQQQILDESFFKPPSINQFDYKNQLDYRNQINFKNQMNYKNQINYNTQTNAPINYKNQINNQINRNQLNNNQINRNQINNRINRNQINNQINRNLINRNQINNNNKLINTTPKYWTTTNPEYFSYQTIEQKPYKDVQLKFEDHESNEKQWDKDVQIYLDKNYVDQQSRKMNKQRLNNKQKNLIKFNNRDEIRKLEKLRYRLQNSKIRVQEQIEELKNLEYRCRRRKLYFFDTLWKNTAIMLLQIDQDLDNQLFRCDELLKEFTDKFEQIENVEKLKQQQLNSLDSNDYIFYSSLTKKQPSKETLEERLNEPRSSLDQLQQHSNKLIKLNKTKLDKIKVVVKDFKKEFKNKL